MTMLEITFVKTQGRAVVMNKNHDANGCITEKIISFSFDETTPSAQTIDALQSCYEKNTQVIVGISSQKIMTHHFELDAALTDTEIMRFLSVKSVEFFGYSAEKLCLDYTRVHRNETGKQKITVIAAHKSFIDAICVFFWQIKISIAAIRVNGDGIAINLLPWRTEKAKRKKQKEFLMVIFSVVFIFIVTLILKSGLLFLANQTIKKTAVIEKDKKLIVLDHPHQHIALLNKLTSMHFKKIAAIKSNQTTEKLLETIATVLPNTITLQSLYLNSHDIKIFGVSDQLSPIQTYRSALQQYLLWKKISIAEIHNDTQNKLQMDFTIWIMP